MIMGEGELKQDFFISDGEYINITLKLTTDNVEKREEIVGILMNSLSDEKEGINLSNVKVNEIYYSGQNPITVIKKLKKDILSDIETTFDDFIIKHDA